MSGILSLASLWSFVRCTDAFIGVPFSPMADDNTPATKAHMERLENRMKSLEDRIETGFRRQHESIDQVLAVLVNVEKRLTSKTDDHEVRIGKLETLVS